MSTTLFTTLSTQELKELIETSIKSAIQVNPNTINKDDDTLLDVKEAANLIKYKETSIYGLVKRKKVPFFKVEGKLLFSKKQLLSWVSNQKLV
jgi:hypothetical protein